MKVKDMSVKERNAFHKTMTYISISMFGLGGFVIYFAEETMSRIDSALFVGGLDLIMISGVLAGIWGKELEEIRRKERTN